jgi:5-methylcytosine-specific restriction protein A
MPDAPARPCVKPGCPEYAVRKGRCAEHAAQFDQQRGTTTERGLGARWRKLRALKLKRDPICQIQTHCGKGIGVSDGMPATEVDHIIPRSRRPDLGFVWSNLQSACQPCNAAKGDR